MLAARLLQSPCLHYKAGAVSGMTVLAVGYFVMLLLAALKPQLPSCAMFENTCWLTDKYGSAKLPALQSLCCAVIQTV